ncbi:MAG: response regulator transcription factor [Leptolyngbyaceae cyanobacterium SM1_1_3]|nr:response regulator transcription factor [Leptolyngbyaceae cyanobacterium SM1_1_3]NJN02708.1 response regulator transcription factor [Leptolyngbyaceae cyanobacterium RM1_1_2]NJO11623.1 response regulator transcription factor [Leptolyngbyaceae cyanobacterium SL_1_1]
MDEIQVALIEDHDLTRVGLRTALQQHGMKFVGEAANGTQGLQLLERCHPDVAIIDIGLPDIDGIELTRKFRQYSKPSASEAKTKILILTMHDSEEVVLAAFAAGADSYCTKEVNTSDLIVAVQETACGNCWIDPAIASIVLRKFRQQPASPEEAMVQIAAIEPEYRQILDTCPLTERELEILDLIVAGHSNAEIAEKLYVTVGTVKTHVRNILNKLCVSDRTQAAVRALRSGLVS